MVSQFKGEAYEPYGLLAGWGVVSSVYGLSPNIIADKASHRLIETYCDPPDVQPMTSGNMLNKSIRWKCSRREEVLQSYLCRPYRTCFTARKTFLSLSVLMIEKHSYVQQSE